MQEQKKYNLADGNIRKRFVTYKQAAELYLRRSRMQRSEWQK